MLKLADLLLLRKNLAALSEVPYFVKLITYYIENLMKVVNWCIENYASLNSDVVSKVIEYTWDSYNHLSGTTTRNIPYEMEYLLNKAVSKWVKTDFIIITANSNRQLDFYCWNLNVLSEIGKLIPSLVFSTKDLLIIQISMPSFCIRAPHYIIPMYHEVGHFIDNLYNISLRVTFNSFTQTDIIDYLDINRLMNPSVIQNHISEYFCDTFAACFVGETISEFLEQIAPGVHHSSTHPSTLHRTNNVHSFLNSVSNPLITNIQSIHMPLAYLYY